MGIGNGPQLLLQIPIKLLLGLLGLDSVVQDGADPMPGQGGHQRFGFGQVLAAAEVLVNGHLQERLHREADLQGQLGDVGTDVHDGAVAHDAKEPGGLLQLGVILAGKCHCGVIKGDRGHGRLGEGIPVDLSRGV